MKYYCNTTTNSTTSTWSVSESFELEWNTDEHGFVSVRVVKKEDKQKLNAIENLKEYEDMFE